MLTTILRRIPQVASIQRVAVSVAGYSQNNYNRSNDNNKNSKYTKPNSVDNYMTNSVNSSLSSGINDGPILYHDEALSAAQHDMVLTDINQATLADIGNRHGIPNLSAGEFSTSPFPVDGIIFDKNNRLMICLKCQRVEKPTSPIVNVWFLVDTGSNCTFLCEDTVSAMYGPKCDALNYFVAIQDPKSEIVCNISHSHFTEVNVLGMAAMIDLEVSIESMNRKQKYFRLARISTTK